MILKPSEAKTLIDPQARVLDLGSSTRSLKLIHRSLLSHLAVLASAQKSGSRISLAPNPEPFEVEYNSTLQLAEDLGNYIKLRPDA